MKNFHLYILWAALYLLCAGLGFLPEPEGVPGLICTGLSVLFFLPPTVLLLRCRRQGDRQTALLIRNLSLVSLGLTLVLLAANVACALGSAALGNFLHGMLVVVSSPMICSGYWVLSLFLWACLLTAAGSLAKKR